MSKNLLKFTMVVVSVYLLIQIYLIFGTWLTEMVSTLFFLTLPFVVGYFVSYMIAPGLGYLAKKVKLTPSLLLAIIIVVVIGTITLISTEVIPSVIRQFSSLSAELINASDTNTKRINELFVQLGFNLEAQFDTAHLVQSVVQFFTSNSSLITGVTSRMFSSILSFGSFMLFFTLTLFYTIDKIEKKSQDRLIRLRSYGHDTLAQLLERIDQIFRLYFRGVFVSMIFVAAGSSLGFWLLGLPNPVGLGIICGLFNVIPLVGPYIGAFPAGFVALSQGWLPLLYVLLIVLVVQQIEGNFVTPNVQGRFLDIQPLSIVIGIVVFGALFGVVGMIFAAPLSATLKVALRYLNGKMPLFLSWWNKIVHSE